MSRTKNSKSKIVGTSIVDATRRHNADGGGRNPLTSFPLVPVGCIMSREMIDALKDISELFINPTNYKPYGVASLTRIMLQMMIETIDRYYEMDYLNYIESRPSALGRASVGEGAKKMSLLIPMPIVQRLNERVLAFNNPLIGTSSVLRFLLEKGIKKLKLDDFYNYVPEKHVRLMATKRLTIKDLQKRYQLESRRV